MKSILAAALFLLAFYLGCCGQKQGNVWYFGDHAGVDFNSGVPVGVSGGQTGGAVEGTAALCDSAGSLLFYTDGEKIWNRNHQVMSNGDSLLGHSSSTQSSLILPLPGNDKLFYVFTTDSWHLNDLRNGFRYTVVDICQDNGLGAVDINRKNILVLDTVSEKLTAVRHTNGTDYWVIVHKYYSDAFYAYLLSSSGIADTVVTQAGSVHDHNGQTAAAIGFMKAAPDGRKIALASINGGDLREMFDFDPATGIVSNYVNLNDTNELYKGGYGLSFSADNSKLYIEANASHVYQYDLLAGGGNADSIRSSKYELNLQGTLNTAIQLGPDGKLYLAMAGQPYISVIAYPNLAGGACGFLPSGIQLPGTCSLGLPNLVDSYSYSNGLVDCPVAVWPSDSYALSMTLYPNPVQTMLRVELPNGESFHLEVLDALGRKAVQSLKVSGTIEIDLEGYPDGIYFLRALNEARVVCKSFLKD